MLLGRPGELLLTPWMTSTWGLGEGGRTNMCKGRLVKGIQWEKEKSQLEWSN